MSGAITTATGSARHGMPSGAKTASEGGASFAPALKLARDLLEGPPTRPGGGTRSTPGPSTPVAPAALGSVGELTQIPALSLMLNTGFAANTDPMEASTPADSGVLLPSGAPVTEGAPDVSTAPTVDDTADQAGPVAAQGIPATAVTVPLPAERMQNSAAYLPTGTPPAEAATLTGGVPTSSAPTNSAPISSVPTSSAPTSSVPTTIAPTTSAPAGAMSAEAEPHGSAPAAVVAPSSGLPEGAQSAAVPTVPAPAAAPPAAPSSPVPGSSGVVLPGTVLPQQTGVPGAHLSTASRAGVERESPSGTQAVSGVAAQAVAVSQPAASQAAAPAAPAPAAPPVPLAAQLYKPVFSLASAAPGEHLITVRVAPDEFGPVTVRATVSAEGMRVELFAPTDAAREALRGILPDLRRDLAGPGLHASVDVSTKDPSDGGGPASSDQDDAARRDRARDLHAPPGDSRSGIPPDEPTTRGPGWHHSTLDLLA